jgi:hypothetical protein
MEGGREEGKREKEYKSKRYLCTHSSFFREEEEASCTWVGAQGERG